MIILSFLAGSKMSCSCALSAPWESGMGSKWRMGLRPLEGVAQMEPFLREGGQVSPVTHALSLSYLPSLSPSFFCPLSPLSSLSSSFPSFCPNFLPSSLTSSRLPFVTLANFRKQSMEPLSELDHGQKLFYVYTSSI